MSSDVLSYGVIAALRTPVEDREEFSEMLYSNKEKTLKINYDGTLVYTDVNNESGGDPYHFTILSGDSLIEMIEELITLTSSYGLEIETSDIKHYSCYWYNGSDCPVNVMTLEEFLNEKT